MANYINSYDILKAKLKYKDDPKKAEKELNKLEKSRAKADAKYGSSLESKINVVSMSGNSYKFCQISFSTLLRSKA